MESYAADLEASYAALRELPGGEVPMAPGVTVVRDEVYAHVPDVAGGPGKELTLDYYHRDADPSGDRPLHDRPAIVFVHGGGWRSGSPFQFHRQAAYLALRHDFFAVSIRYRLAGDAPFPAAVEDVKCAVRWVRAHAAQWRIDPHRIAIVGGSAGAHLAALVAATAGDARLEGRGGHPEQSSAVNAAICFNGAFDLPDLCGRTEWGATLIGNFLGKTLDEDLSFYRLASPISHVHAGMPPMLLMHGDADKAIDCVQSRAMHEALQACGASSELLIRPGFGHGWFNQHPDFMHVMETMEAFLTRCFRLDAPVNVG